jgi:hypothetical protein
MEYDSDPVVWNQGVFQPSAAVLSSLLGTLRNFHYAVFVFTADDRLQLRGERHAAVRDNVIFELGLFMGALGQQSCFFVLPRGVEDLHLPTDILGIVPLTYNPSRADGNLIAALGPACNALRREMRKHAPKGAAGTIATEPAQRLSEYLERWNSEPLVSIRARLREGIPPDHYGRSQQDIADVRAVFAFVESVSDAVLSGSLPEAATKEAFAEVISIFWPFAQIYIAPPNQVDDYWKELPQIAKLYMKWK